MADPKRRPGRPEIGGRVTVSLGPLLARIDAARGKRSRAAWLRAAAEQALTTQTEEPT